MIKVIAIDFGGVYFKWSFGVYARQFSKITGADYDTVRSALGKKIRDLHVQRISQKEYWDHFCKAIGKDVDHRILRKATIDQLKPDKPVINFVKRLRKNYTIVLLSNQTPVMDEVEKKYKFHRNFDIFLCSHIVRVQKPYKNIYRLLIKKAKVKPKEIVFIDDQKRNLIPAKKMGINIILFRNLAQLKKDLSKLGVNA